MAPWNFMLLYDLIEKYGIKYIFYTSECGYFDPHELGGDDPYKGKPFPDGFYTRTFNNCPFLRVRLVHRMTRIYEVDLSRVLFKDDFEGYYGDDSSPIWGSKQEGYGNWHIRTVDGNKIFEASSTAPNRGTAIFAGDTSWTNYILEAKIWTNGSYWGLIYRADAAGKHRVSPGSAHHWSDRWPAGSLDGPEGNGVRVKANSQWHTLVKDK